MKAHIKITLKPGVLDPQGKAIQHALRNLGFHSVGDVRQGKHIEVDLAETNREEAKAQVAAMCRQLLANMIIEDYSFELVEA